MFLCALRKYQEIPQLVTTLDNIEASTFTSIDGIVPTRPLVTYLRVIGSRKSVILKPVDVILFTTNCLSKLMLPVHLQCDENRLNLFSTLK